MTTESTADNSDKRIDFLLMRDSGRVYVECTVLFEDDDDNTDGGQAWILDCINQAKHPDFSVDVEMHLRGNEWPRVLDITQPIEEWLMSLDADAVAAHIAAGDPALARIVGAPRAGAKRFASEFATLLERTRGCDSFGHRTDQSMA